jgi:predicted dehydrogenase
MARQPGARMGRLTTKQEHRMQPLRYVVLGAGGIAHWHVESYNKQPDVSVAGFLDSNPKTLEAWKKQFPQAELETTDAASLLAKTKPDFAAVLAPNAVHAELVKAAFAAGCHVMCEKPMAMTVAEAKSMEDARVAAGKLGAINFSYRNVASFRFAREVIRAGELGPIQRMNVRYLQSFLGPSPTFVWRNDIKLAGFGALGDLGVHMLDGVAFVTGLSAQRMVGLAKTLVGPKHDAQGNLRPITTDTNAAFLAEYENGAVGTYETSQCIPGYGNFFQIEVSGPKGVLRICSEDNDSIAFYAGTTLSRYGTWSHENVPKVTLPTGFVEHQPKSTMESFVKLMRGEKVECASFADGVAAQRCLEAIVESIRTNAWAKV